MQALRKEVAPHLKFLRRQVEKLQKTEALKEDARIRFVDFFAVEYAHLSQERAAIDGEREVKKKELDAIVQEVGDAKDALKDAPGDVRAKEIVRLSDELEGVRVKRSEATRSAAKIAGQIEALQKVSGEKAVDVAQLEQLLASVEQEFENKRSSLEVLVAFVERVIADVRSLARGESSGKSDIERLEKERAQSEANEQELTAREEALAADLDRIRKELDAARAEERDQERSLFELTARERDARHELSLLNSRESRLKIEEDEFKRDIGETAVLIGREVLAYEEKTPLPRERAEQERERRELQKIKIRIEEMGAGGGDEIMREYKEAEEREQHLEKELADLDTSKESLTQLITELDEELRTRFKEGLSDINKQFVHFFGLMFDGGNASLVITKETPRRLQSLEDGDDDGIPDEMEKTVEGIDISLTIPRKRIRSLTMLSGGRAGTYFNRTHFCHVCGESTTVFSVG